MNKYYILTRFNLRLWPTDKKQKPTQTDEWLKTRFQLSHDVPVTQTVLWHVSMGIPQNQLPIL